MKKLLFFASVLTLFSACNNSTCTDGLKNQNEVGIDCGGSCTACPIEYPETGTYGSNVLYGIDSLNLTVGDYSMKAIVPEGSELEIELELISGSEWFYSNSTSGWIVSALSAGKQTFTIPNSGTFDLNFHLAYSADPGVVGGSFYIHYKENGIPASSSKIVTWN